MPHFQNQIGKMKHLKKRTKESWAFRKEARINFKTEKEPKMKFFDFGAFQN